MEQATYNVQPQPRVVKVIKRKVEDIQLLRDTFVDTRIPVAAYARVSTNHEEQEDSLERQTEHYTEKIKNNLEWKFVGIYSDPGITGTRADKRPGFQRLIADCKEGKIKKNVAEIVIAKHRNGPTGVVELYFKDECTKFLNLNNDTGEPAEGGEEEGAKPVKLVSGYDDLPEPPPEMKEEPPFKSIDDEIF